VSGPKSPREVLAQADALRDPVVKCRELLKLANDPGLSLIVAVARKEQEPNFFGLFSVDRSFVIPGLTEALIETIERFASEAEAEAAELEASVVVAS